MASMPMVLHQKQVLEATMTRPGTGHVAAT